MTLRSAAHVLALARCAAVAALGCAPSFAQLGVEVAGPFPLAPPTTGSSLHRGAAYFQGSLWVGGDATPPGALGQIHELSLAGSKRSSTLGCPTPGSSAEPPADFTQIGDCLVSAKLDRICCYTKRATGLVCVLEATMAATATGVTFASDTGLFYGASGTGPIRIFTLDTVTATVTVVGILPATGKDIRGLAYDPVTSMLWAACANNQQGGPLNLVEFNQIDPSTGALTGLMFMGRTSLPPPNVLAGCEIYHDVRNPGRLSIVTVHRSTPDALMIYNLDSPWPCSGDPRVYCTSKVNSLGCVPSITYTGAPTASATSGFEVRGVNKLNNRGGLLFYGLLGRSNQPFLGGFKCVANPIRRAPILNSGGNAPPTSDCSGVFAIDMNAFAHGLLGGAPDPGLLLPGTTVRAQWWSRDSASTPSGASLSDAIEYDICP